jgi:hypothetical protein
LPLTIIVAIRRFSKGPRHSPENAAQFGFSRRCRYVGFIVRDYIAPLIFLGFL